MDLTISSAQRLGREFSDDLRLLLDDLGIGDGGGDQLKDGNLLVAEACSAALAKLDAADERQ